MAARRVPPEKLRRWRNLFYPKIFTYEKINTPCMKWTQIDPKILDKRVTADPRKWPGLEITKQGSEAAYPPIKPRYPPGRWGEMKEERAWLWQEWKDALDEWESVSDRIAIMSQLEKVTYTVKSFDCTIGSLPYLQYVTKTHAIEGLPDAYNQINVEDELLRTVRNLTEETLVQEFEHQTRKDALSRNELALESHQKRLAVGQILQNVLAVLGDRKHIERSQWDEDVRVRAFWRRSGFGESRPRGTASVTGDIKLQYTHKMSYQIRVEKPLPTFLPMDDPLCFGDYPEFHYRPCTVGQMSRNMKPSWIPGHHVGDPCEFSLLSAFVLPYGTTSALSRIPTKYRDDLWLGSGIVNCHASLTAQAYYQGFSLFHHLTYPFTTQFILTDGQRFAFFAYQLNTIELWKPEGAVPERNLCWYTEPIRLYDEIKDGKVVGFNDDCLRNIVKCTLLEPVDRKCDLRPHLVGDSDETTAPVTSRDYINDLRDRHVEIIDDTVVYDQTE